MPSTVIRELAYEPAARRLLITFTSGRRYSYEDVPPQLAQDMQRAFSKGVFFNRRILDRFRATPEPPAGDPTI